MTTNVPTDLPQFPQPMLWRGSCLFSCKQSNKKSHIADLPKNLVLNGQICLSKSTTSHHRINNEKKIPIYFCRKFSLYYHI